MTKFDRWFIAALATLVVSVFGGIGFSSQYNNYMNRQAYYICLAKQEQVDNKYLSIVKESDKNFLSSSRPDLHCRN